MFSMCAGGHLQGAQRGPLRIFEFLELFASIARSRSRSPNDIVSANSCILPTLFFHVLIWSILCCTSDLLTTGLSFLNI